MKFPQWHVETCIHALNDVNSYLVVIVKKLLQMQNKCWTIIQNVADTKNWFYFLSSVAEIFHFFWPFLKELLVLLYVLMSMLMEMLIMSTGHVIALMFRSLLWNISSCSNLNFIDVYANILFDMPSHFKSKYGSNKTRNIFCSQLKAKDVQIMSLWVFSYCRL